METSGRSRPGTAYQERSSNRELRWWLEIPITKTLHDFLGYWLGPARKRSSHPASEPYISEKPRPSVRGERRRVVSRLFCLQRATGEDVPGISGLGHLDLTKDLRDPFPGHGLASDERSKDVHEEQLKPDQIAMGIVKRISGRQRLL